MSKVRTKSLEEIAQVLQLIANNRDILAKNPSMVPEIVERVSQDMEIEFVSFKPSHQKTNELAKQFGEHVDEICGRIKEEVLEQVRSEISGIFGTAKIELSSRAMMQAMSESIRRLSLIREVKAVYAFTKPENLRVIVIHDSADRLSTLRRVVEIENWLDSSFQDLYFEFHVLHKSEANENLTRDALLIFERI